MSRLKPEKLHVRVQERVNAEEPVIGRRYTLTHSDRTGDLYLTVGRSYDRAQVTGWYTRLMRDEVLAEWLEGDDGPLLQVHCHVSGGIVFGPAGWRYAIFQRELPLVLEAFRYGDCGLFAAHPELDDAPIEVRFHARQRR